MQHTTSNISIIALCVTVIALALVLRRAPEPVYAVVKDAPQPGEHIIPLDTRRRSA